MAENWRRSGKAKSMCVRMLLSIVLDFGYEIWERGRNKNNTKIAGPLTVQRRKNWKGNEFDYFCWVFVYLFLSTDAEYGIQYSNCGFHLSTFRHHKCRTYLLLTSTSEEIRLQLLEMPQAWVRWQVTITSIDPLHSHRLVHRINQLEFYVGVAIVGVSEKNKESEWQAISRA